MRAIAFCPAHITGFFKASMPNPGQSLLEAGSVGAGFSISHGVRTTVDAEPSSNPTIKVSTTGYEPGDTAVSEHVAAMYAKIAEKNLEIRVNHEIKIPVGYGLGCSSAVALSLSLALNEALGIGLSRTQAAQLAHKAEIECGTGLGDVAGVLDGGFEIRTQAGAPGVGNIKKSSLNSNVILVCLAPMSTRKFISENLSRINGLGGKMVIELSGKYSDQRFQDMSKKFARHIDIITPQMQKIIDDLTRAEIKCGVALFGQTLFVITDEQTSRRALQTLEPYKDYILCSSIDNVGARLC